MAIPWAAIAQGAQTGMSFLSRLFGGSSNSAKTNLNLNKKLMDYQYKLERQSRQTSFQDTKQDLLGAGYNPLLAVGQQSNYTPVSSGVSAQSSLEEANSTLGAITGASSAISAINRNRSMNNTDMITALSNRSHNNADIDYITSKTAGQNISNTIQSATGLSRAIQEVKNLRHQGALTKAQTKATIQGIAESQSNILLNNARTEEARSNSALTNQYKRQEQIKADTSQEIAKWLSEHPGWRGAYNTMIATGFNPQQAMDSLIRAGGDLAKAKAFGQGLKSGRGRR